MKHTLVSLLSVCLFGLADAVVAQQARCVQAAPWDSQRELNGAALAFDAVRGQVLYYGGDIRNGTIPPTGQTYSFDGSAWLPGQPGLARARAAMAFDSARGRMMVFGGEYLRPEIGLLISSDTQVFDGVRWSTLPTPPEMLPRYYAIMAFDAARGRMVLHGGYGYSGSINETWEHDGVSWARVAHGPTNFGGRMTYDEARQRVVRVTYGRRQPGANFEVMVYEWDGAEWREILTTNQPASGNQCSVFYLPSLRTIVRQTTVPHIAGLHHASEFWALQGSVWRRIEVDGPVIPTSIMVDSVYDSGREVLVVHTMLHGTWEVRFGHFASARAYGSSCGSPSLQLQDDPAQKPLLGQSARATVRNCPGGIAFVGIGLDKTSFLGAPLPLALDSLGMPGCRLLHSFDLGGCYLAQPIGAQECAWSIAIPADPVLRGLHVYAQSYGFDAAANAAGIVLSNGLDWRIGDE
jgi:hypothetical protein